MKAALAALLLGGAVAAHPAPRLDPVFGDNGVLQRDRPVRISGSAEPGEQLIVVLAGQSRRTRADSSGRWTVELPPMKAGGPHDLTVRGAADAAATATNLLVGDVWLCSGQSNMEWPVRRSLNGETEVQGAFDDRVRLMTIAHDTALEPQSSFEQAPEWQPLTPETAAEFSGACYFMTRDLRETQDVPFGLIDASWGGTRIRPWIDEAAARASGSGGDAQLLALFRSDPAAAARRFGEQWGAWWRTRTGDAAGQEPWNDSSRLEWRPVPSIEPWENWQSGEFAEFDGHVWMRKRFTLTPGEAAAGAMLSLGVIDDLDQTFVNGVGVGSSYGWDNPREYQLTADLLQPGGNEILVNVGDSWSFGGFIGPAERLKVTLAGGEVKPLGEGWEYSVVPSAVGTPPRASWDSHAGLGTIYNAMIAPLHEVGLRGVAWYQGESDAGVPGYDERLAALMASWRTQFADPQLPFLIVGLAGNGPPPSSPVASGWAQVQDEQRQAAERDTNAVLVPAIDLGERFDIHPPNKQEVGRRLALAAQALVYDNPAGKLAPMPIAAARTPDGVRVDFTGPLRTLSGDRPLAFELCAAEQASCRYADGRVSGNSVVLAGDGLPATRVRYAWSAFAIVNLYSGDLPAPTFELPIR